MSKLAIFTVKSIHQHQGRYYTYGGFGQYLSSIRSYFNQTVLIAHVRNAPPRPGDYEILLDRLEIVGLPPIRNELESLVTLPVQFWRCLFALRGIDVAHVRMPDYTGVVGALACRLRGVPYFCQIIDDWALFGKSVPWSKRYGLGAGLKAHFKVYDWFERQAAKGQLVFAQGGTCHAKHAKAADSRLVFSAAHTIEDVISTPRPRFGNAIPLILNVARLTGVKNQALLLQAVAKLRDDGQHWRLRLVGEGPSRGALDAMAKQLDITDRVELVGKVNHGQELWEHFDEADVFALSSFSEGTPKVLLESMARGLPVVATAVSGVPDMVPHEIRGLLIKHPELPELVSALQRMRSDDTLRPACVLNGLRFARENTVEIQNRMMMEIVWAKWPHLKP